MQADLMGQMLVNKCNELQVPLVMYAEDRACGSGYQLMMHGQVHLANECSFVGNIGYRITPLMLKHFLGANQIDAKYAHKGEHKVRLNRL